MADTDQTKFETVIGERDHWHKIAAEQQKTIENLQRELERKTIGESAFAGGVRVEGDSAIEKLQRERDQYKAELDTMKGHLLGYLQGSWDQAHSKQEQGIQLKKVLTSKRSGQLPDVIQEWFKLPDILDKYLASYLAPKDSIESALLSLEQSNSLPILERIMSYNIFTGLLDSSFLVYAFVNSLLEKPQIIIYCILGELEVKQEVRENTVSRLPLEWAKQHIHPKIGSHRYLFEALNHAYKYSVSGNSQEDYAEDNLISVGTLQKYVTILKNTEQVSRQIDPNIEKYLPNF